MSKSPSTAVPDGRDSSGRFGAGNRFGKGNVYARSTASWRAALTSAVSEGDLAEVGRAILEKCKTGDIGACKLLLGYLLGPPLAPISPDELDADELRVLKGRPSELDRLLLDHDQLV